MGQFFKNSLFPLHSLSRTPSQPKIIFHSNPFTLKLVFCIFNFKVCFLKHFLLFVLDYAKIKLGFSKLGIFSKMGWGSWFCEKFFKILIGLSPIWSLCICVGPVWHSNHVLRLFHLCSCIVHLCCGLLHAKCLTKCSSDILCCIGLKWVPVLRVTLNWTCFG